MTKAKDGKLTDFAARAGISIGYASQLLSEPGSKGHRTPTVEKALTIYRRTGKQLGILRGASRAEARTIVRCAERTGTIPPDAEPPLPLEADEAVAA